MKVGIDPVTYESYYIKSGNNSREREKYFDEDHENSQLNPIRTTRIDPKNTCKAFAESPTLGNR